MEMQRSYYTRFFGKVDLTEVAAVMLKRAEVKPEVQAWVQQQIRQAADYHADRAEIIIEETPLSVSPAVAHVMLSIGFDPNQEPTSEEVNLTLVCTEKAAYHEGWAVQAEIAFSR